jgi:hypothetical protein
MVSRPPSDQSWLAKLHPSFPEIAELNRDFEIDYREIESDYQRRLKQANITAAQWVEIRREFIQRGEQLADTLTERLADLFRRYPDGPRENPSSIYLDVIASDATEGQEAFVRYLHWVRRHESLDRAADPETAGDLTAVDAIAREQKDLLRIAHRQGPLRAFQGETIHRQLLGIIIDYEIAPLTSEERADVFDRYCPCGNDHDTETLERENRRLRRELKA